MMNVQSGDTNYERFDPQRKTWKKVIMGCTAILLVGGVVALICVLTIGKSGGSSSSEDGYFQHDLFTVNNEKAQSIETEAAVTGQGPNEEDLYRTSEPIQLTYEITNKYKKPKTIAIRDTPLESGEVLTNFLSHLSDIFWYGDTTENGGTMYQTLTLQPDETRRVVVDLDDNVVFSKFGEVPISLSYTLYMPTEDRQELNRNTRSVFATTNEVIFTVTKGAGHQIPEPEDGPGDAGRRALLRRRTNVFVGSDGIPTYTADCIDDPSKTGYTYVGSDRVVPCERLADNCDSKAVKRWCPSACGTCASIEDGFTHPRIDKSQSVSHVSGSSKEECSGSVRGGDGRTQTEMQWIREAERVKHDFCSTMLWHIQTKSSELLTNFREWFGMYDNQRWQKLRDGFAKICSADNYKYNCNPSERSATDRCTINFDWQGNSYTNWRQQDMVANDLKQKFIDKCNSPTKCTFSGTIAWVSSGDAFDRVINICPIGFWLQTDQAGQDFSSKAAVIIHELSHFVDMADTTDYTYDKDDMRDWAKEMSKDMLKNAASWDNFSEDPDFTAKRWSDFGAGGSSTGSSSTGSSSSGSTTSGSSTTGSTSGSTTGSSSGSTTGSSSGGSGNNSEYFTMVGDCDVSDDCVSSKNYPSKHGSNEACTVTMNKDARVTAGNTFELETGYDKLSFERKSGSKTDIVSSKDVPSSVSSGDMFKWASDKSVNKQGWQMCFSGNSGGGGGSSGGDSGGGGSRTQYSVKSAVNGAKCGGSSKTKNLGSVSENDWIGCANKALADSGCSHMFYTNAHSGGTTCGCVKEGKICSKEDDPDYIVFKIVPDGTCEDHNWLDSQSHPCSTYVDHEYCDNGIIHKDVKDACNGSCERDGMYASDACCACGGGRIV